MAVRWKDAHARISDDYTEDALKKEFHKPAIYTTFGLLVYRDAEGISLACDVSEDGYRGLNFIPAEMILEITDFGIPRRKRAPKPKPSPQTP